MSISNPIVYTKSLYEKSIRKVYSEKSIYETVYVYTEKSISNRKVYTKSLYEKSIRKVYI